MCFPMEKAVEEKFDFLGLQCVITRADITQPDGMSAHRCGYVRIPPGHPWHPGAFVPKPPEVPDDPNMTPELKGSWKSLMERSATRDHRYDEIPMEVHGGLTFGELENCVHEDGVGYWVGFDFHHYMDAALPPGDPRIDVYEKKLGMKLSMFGNGHYWTLNEVEVEVMRAAVQVHQATIEKIDGILEAKRKLITQTA